MRIFHALVQRQYCTVEPKIVHPSSLATAMIAFLCLPTFLPKWKLIFNVSMIHREGFKDCDIFAQIQCLPHKSLSADCSHVFTIVHKYWEDTCFPRKSAFPQLYSPKHEPASSKHLPSGHISCDPPEHLMQEPWHTVVVWLYNYKTPHHEDFLKHTHLK